MRFTKGPRVSRGSTTKRSGSSSSSRCRTSLPENRGYLAVRNGALQLLDQNGSQAGTVKPGRGQRLASPALTGDGGRLALVDDFLGEQTAPQSMRRLWLDAYRRGWHAPNLERPELVVALAQAHGLHLLKQRDLTPHLRLRVLPDRLAALLLAVGERLPLHHAILPSMLGSMALQQCLRRRWIRYCFLVFEKLA